MGNIVRGTIDIWPPLEWSEVEPTGFMILNPEGIPVLPGTRLSLLCPEETIVTTPEGVLRKYTFDTLSAATPDIPLQGRAILRREIEEVIQTFPGHGFGDIEDTILFRGDVFYDYWRIRVTPEDQVVYEEGTITWGVPELNT